MPLFECLKNCKKFFIVYVVVQFGGAECPRVEGNCKKAKLQARIKLTALCSVIDKENLIEFPLDFLHYLYNYYMVCALLSHAYHVTCHMMSCDMIL